MSVDSRFARSQPRQLHLGAFIKPAGEYHAGWRHPDTPANAGVNFSFVAQLARVAEAARFDAVFLPDLAGVPGSRADVLTRVAVVNDGFEPTTLLGALSTLTSSIGLIASASTSFNSSDTVAHTFGSLDRLSNGRAGWNVVTSLNDSEAQNFGHDQHLAHTDRYAIAREFFEEVASIWDSSDLPQGRPVVAQAGSSGPGRELAASIGDLVFSRALDLPQAREYYRDIKKRAEAAGRDPSTVLVLPELSAVIGRTRAEAEDKFALLRELLSPRVALADLEYWLGGIDLSDQPLDGPLPALPATNRSRGAQQEIYDEADRKGLTLGQLAKQIADGDGAIIGTAHEVADHIEERFTSGAADGFNVSFPYQPTTLVDFAEQVVPELQRRGLFRTEYTGTTLRDHLGLAPTKSKAAV